MQPKHQPLADSTGHATLLQTAVRIVVAHVAHSAVPADALDVLIARVYGTLAGCRSIAGAPPVPPLPQPAVDPDKSVTDRWLICLEDGKRFKLLGPHLRNCCGLTPHQYRLRWGLPDTYPMVAPEYSRHRSTLAKEMGFGQRPAKGAKNALRPRVGRK